MVRVDVSPSLLALIENKNYGMLEANKALEDGIKQVPSAGWVHIDVMDAKYVPQANFLEIEPIYHIHHIGQLTNKKIDTHLMVNNPENFIDFYGYASDILTFQYGGSDKPHEVVRKIKYRGIGVGIALNPDEPLELIDDMIEDLDMVLLMSVFPGKCGQSYHPEVNDKLRTLAETLNKRNPRAMIQVDGGIKTHNATEIIDNVREYELDLLLVSGSGVYGHDVPNDAVRQISEKG